MTPGRVVLVRTDASVAIGTGHLRRCLSLAVALRDLGLSSLFLTRNLDFNSTESVRDAGFEVIELAQPSASFEPPPGAPPHAAWARVDQLRDAEETIAVAAGRRVHATIVDSYSFDASWHDAVRRGLESPVVVIDDLADRAHSADLLIDHNFCDEPRIKHAAGIAAGAKLVAGPRYALIDPVYCAADRWRLPATPSIGIFLGGADEAGLALPIARALRALGFSGPIGVATTSANPRLNDLRDAAEWLGAAPVIDSPVLAEFFASHSIQIGAAGGATWERFCIGAPSYLLVLASNQLQVLSLLRSANVALLHEGPNDPGAIATGALALLDQPARCQQISTLAREMVDGRGAARVALAVAALNATPRPAGPADSAMLFEWRNHPGIRASSRTQELIAFSSHEDWLTNTLSRDDRHLLIVEAGKRPIGVVRFDLVGPGHWEVSIYCDPHSPGMGWGAPTLRAAEDWLLAQHGHGAMIEAETLPDNQRSQRLFVAAGYRQDDNHFFKSLFQPEVMGNV